MINNIILVLKALAIMGGEAIATIGIALLIQLIFYKVFNINIYKNITKILK